MKVIGKKIGVTGRVLKCSRRVGGYVGVDSM